VQVAGLQPRSGRGPKITFRQDVSRLCRTWLHLARREYDGRHVIMVIRVSGKVRETEHEAPVTSLRVAEPGATG
jgi:hypothetical protein